MPRSPRIELDGAVYHVMDRGNRREPIVFDDQDRQLFVQTFSEACSMTGWEVFACDSIISLAVNFDFSC